MFFHLHQFGIVVYVADDFKVLVYPILLGCVNSAVKICEMPSVIYPCYFISAFVFRKQVVKMTGYYIPFKNFLAVLVGKTCVLSDGFEDYLER